MLFKDIQRQILSFTCFTVATVSAKHFWIHRTVQKKRRSTKTLMKTAVFLTCEGDISGRVFLYEVDSKAGVGDLEFICIRKLGFRRTVDQGLGKRFRQFHGRQALTPGGGSVGGSIYLPALPQISACETTSARKVRARIRTIPTTSSTLITRQIFKSISAVR